MKDLVVSKLMPIEDEGTAQRPLVIDGERPWVLNRNPKRIHLSSVLIVRYVHFTRDGSVWPTD